MQANPVVFRALLVLGIVMAACPASATGRQGAESTLPEIKKDCSLCHLDIRKGPALRKPVSGLCIDCHQDRTAPNEHRVDVVPSMEVTTLPLSAGKIACTTCHDPHRNSYGKLLRMPQNKLCFQCHRM